MKRHIVSFCIFSFLNIVLTACTEEIKNELGLGHEIAFKIMPSQPAATRSAAEYKVPEPQPYVCQGDTFYLQTEITPMDSTMGSGRQVTTRGAEKNASNLQTDGFKVSAYNTADGTTRGSSYFEYLTATYADSKFTPQDAGTAKYWPTGKLMFYAYYPAATASNGITQGTNASTLTYTVPSTPANQPDLMTARATDQQYTSGDGTAALTFNHALCAIKFQTGTDIAGGTINSITFNNIYTSGTYNLDTQTWSSTTSGNKSFTGLSKTTTEGTSGTAILIGDNTLMMIPQTFDNNNQTITINFTVGGTPHTLSYVLNGTSWGQGQCITYTITTEGLVWEYVLEATGGETAYTGGNATFNVKSYRYKRTTPSVVEPVAWTIDGYKVDGASDFSATKPTWVSSITTSGIGTSTTSATNAGTATLAAQTSTTGAASFTDIERGTSSAPYDLSTKGGATTRNTANCYVVDAPGWYKIPLVYGNGIKNGANNTSAYNSATFVDYNGTQIRNLSGPYLKYSTGSIGTSGTGAPIIVWQDVQNMVKNLSVDTSTDNGYLIFYVDGSYIAEGNAVLAVKNTSGTIMWSWHIWVTGIDINQTISITAYNTSYSYQIMPINLGWVSASSTTTWSGRGLTVKIKQNGSENMITTNIYQKPHEIPSRLGDNTFYQMGRKDPFPGVKTDQNAQKSAWNNSNAAYTISTSTSLANYATSIKNPNTYYGVNSSSKSDWASSDVPIIDRWSATETAYGHDVYNSPTKSIYDPNPVGFKMPSSGTFTGVISTTSINETTASNINGTYNTTEHGWDFYTLPSNNHFFWPSTGQIRVGVYYSYGNGGCYWYAQSHDDTNSAPYFYSNNGVVGLRHALERSSAHSVRPIVD